MMHLGVYDLRTCYFQCVRSSKRSYHMSVLRTCYFKCVKSCEAFLSHGPPRIFDEQQILLNTVQGRHVKSIFDEQQIFYKIQNAYDRGLLCAPNNITFFDKRNGVLIARKKTQHNILNLLIFSSISALLFSYFGMLEQLIWFRMHGTVRLLLEIAIYWLSSVVYENCAMQIGRASCRERV